MIYSIESEQMQTRVTRVIAASAARSSSARLHRRPGGGVDRRGALDCGCGCRRWLRESLMAFAQMSRCTIKTYDEMAITS
jgi:hypothetical protein